MIIPTLYVSDNSATCLTVTDMCASNRTCGVDHAQEYYYSHDCKYLEELSGCPEDPEVTEWLNSEDGQASTEYSTDIANQSYQGEGQC